MFIIEHFQYMTIVMIAVVWTAAVCTFFYMFMKYGEIDWNFHINFTPLYLVIVVMLLMVVYGT